MELNSVNHHHKTINGIDTLRLVLLYGYVMRSQKNVRVVSVFGKNQFTFGSKSAFCSNKSILKIDFLFLCLSPGAPPAPVRLSGQKIFEEKFSPFQWTGRWKFASNGGSSRHFYRRLNASKSAQIESREDSKTHSVAEIGKMVFFL